MNFQFWTYLKNTHPTKVLHILHATKVCHILYTIEFTLSKSP